MIQKLFEVYIWLIFEENNLQGILHYTAMIILNVLHMLFQMVLHPHPSPPWLPFNMRLFVPLRIHLDISIDWKCFQL